MLRLLQAANITDQDIDTIIQKGQRATEELNNKMTQFTENAMKFTLDGGFNAYEFKDEEEAPEDAVDLKQLIGARQRPVFESRKAPEDGVNLSLLIVAPQQPKAWTTDSSMHI